MRPCASLRPELLPGDRLLVIADNCGDGTAEVARRAGVEVAEREDPGRRGKGYALRFGLDRLRQDPPEIVVVVDADCLVEPGAIGALARASVAAARPVQARYLMRPGPRASVLSAFAFLVKNSVRPLGLWRLALPCQLMGTGMAFPWPLIERVQPEAGNLVEDLQLGADLARAGHPPLFVPEARVTSALPEGRRAAFAQRTRWEHGHLETLLRMGPRLLLAGLRARRMELVAMAADLCVPPLALLVTLQVALVLVSFGAWLASSSAAPLALASLGLGLCAAAVALAWWFHARDVISARELLRAPLYVAGKLPIYFRFLVRRQRDWVRTERGGPRDGSAP